MLGTLGSILAAAMNRLSEHAALVGIENIDEFTFRAFVLAEIRRRYPGARCQTEWRKFDLVIQLPRRNALIEFKFYVTRRSYALDGSPTHWKGGPGPKNEGEFDACIEKLKRTTIDGIDGKYLVVVYEQRCDRNTQYSFAKSYGQLATGNGVTGVFPIAHRCEEQLACKVLAVE